jgi:hypothetical protein
MAGLRVIVDPGELRERVRFDPVASVSTPDDLGNSQGDFDPAQGVTRSAKFLMRPGSEVMTEARLAGRQPLTVVVGYDSQTRTITPDWREDMDRLRQWITLVCEAGVQT